MKAKTSLSILLIAMMLLTLMSGTVAGATRVTELVGRIERDHDEDFISFDVELVNDDVFDEEELLYVATIVTEVGGSKHFTDRYKLVLIPEEGVDLSGITLQKTSIEGTVVTDIEKLDRRGGIAVSFEIVSTDHGLPFKDVGKKDWYFEAVKYVYEHGLMNGTAAHDFDPKASTTREQLVTVLWRMNGSPKTKGALPFTDVKKSSYAKNAIIWAAEHNVVKGVSDTAFDPTGPITREQLVTLFYRYSEYLGGNPVGHVNTLGAYEDMREISAYARDAMAWAVEHQIVTGITATTLEPRGTATRGQIATIMMRYEQLAATPMQLELPEQQHTTLLSAIYTEK